MEAGLHVWFGGRMFALQGAGGGALVAFRAGENPAGRLHVRRRRSGVPGQGLESARDMVCCGPLQWLLARGSFGLPRRHPSGAAAAQNSRVSFG